MLQRTSVGSHRISPDRRTGRGMNAVRILRFAVRRPTAPPPFARPKDQPLLLAKPNQANGSARTQSAAIGKNAAPA